MAEQKTNVMRILEKSKIGYSYHTYDHSDGAIDGISVAQKLGQDVNSVYKTLVTKGVSGGYFVFVIPVAAELDLKKAAKSVGEKSVAMIKVDEINKVTGYIRGGCSPVGMKKLYKTVFHGDVLSLSTVIVSGGKLGHQIELAPRDLIALVSATTAEITQSSEE